MYEAIKNTENFSQMFYFLSILSQKKTQHCFYCMNNMIRNIHSICGQLQQMCHRQRVDE